jgi:predicted nucleic acid-binding Zn ribbon protein
MVKDAASLDSILKKVIKKLKKTGVTEEDLHRAWLAAVGKKAVKHTKPRTLRKLRLVVNIDSSTWLYELTLKKKDILKKLEEELGAKKIKDIRFRIGEI